MDRIQPGQKAHGKRKRDKVIAFARTRWGKALLILGALFVINLLFWALFHIGCGRAPKGFLPLSFPTSEEAVRATGTLKDYTRPESRTFLTVPEWYLVFNPQEYAAHLATSRPSAFPYFRSIGQVWGTYCKVTGYANAGYPSDAGSHLMDGVIVSSFTAEYLVKGAWEHTIGWFFELTAGGKRVPEDDYAARIAREYGEFVPTRPFYEFPYVRALAGLWNETSLIGDAPLRNIERHVFLSIEYGIKAAYCVPITWATHAIYGYAPEELYAIAENVPLEAYEDLRVRHVAEIDADTAVIALPHYQGFTDTVPGFVATGARLIEVAGNDEIVLTVVTPKSSKWTPPYADVLFRMPMLAASHEERLVLRVALRDLVTLLASFPDAGARLEHLYDY